MLPRESKNYWEKRGNIKENSINSINMNMDEVT